MKRLAEAMERIGEERLIALIQAATKDAGPRPWLGIGDDAALLIPSEGKATVVSVDDHREGVHFERSWCPPEAIGRRAAGAALSDLAAMGASVQGVLLALHLPKNFGEDLLAPLIAGFADQLRQSNAPLIGGNLSASEALGLSVTVLGEVDPERALRRDAARPGDGLFVSGGLGGSALAFRALAHKDARILAHPELSDLLNRYLSPRAQIALGLALAAGSGRPPAAMDISDGLARDAARMALASGLSFRIHAASALHPSVASIALAAGLDGPALALASGEEYQLLVSAPREQWQALEERGLLRIGEALAGPAGALFDGQGQAIDPALGFDHFAGSD